MVQIKEILALETSKRLELVELIWDSVEKDSLTELPKEIKKLLDNRLDDLEANPNAFSSWEEVYNRVKNS